MHAALLPGKRKGINQSPTISTGIKEELKNQSQNHSSELVHAGGFCK